MTKSVHALHRMWTIKYPELEGTDSQRAPRTAEEGNERSPSLHGFVLSPHRNPAAPHPLLGLNSSPGRNFLWGHTCSCRGSFISCSPCRDDCMGCPQKSPPASPVITSWASFCITAYTSSCLPLYFLPPAAVFFLNYAFRKGSMVLLIGSSFGVGWVGVVHASWNWLWLKGCQWPSPTKVAPVAPLLPALPVMSNIPVSFTPGNSRSN